MSFNITEARAKYGVLLRISSSSGLFYFRLPTKAEFDNYNDILGKFEIPMLASDFIIDKCLLYPLDIDMWAGEIIPLANAIIEKSGFHDIKQFQDIVYEYRSKSEALGERVISMILKAFPGYSLNQVENMTAREMARHLVLAEIILEQSSQIAGVENKSQTEQITKELSNKDKQQAEKLRNISKEALDQVKGRNVS